ncbi:hypothetical protein HOA59_03100 [archaeon]|jgi:hypothetical protein|nr:hypothetical protein [archaeon]MBT6824396.1 hypothetical protein [archaeon]MBT7107325.1 hypothetical protein [archaeon]MBT7297372.1 hypothetical protein [archaeon]
MKKGISPLISWILLFGFAVSMGTGISIWIINEMETINIGGPGPETYCKDVRLSINEVCRAADNKTINFNVTNTGNFKIWRYTVGRETTTIPEQWCLDLYAGPSTQGLEPGLSDQFNLSIAGDMSPIIGTDSMIYKECYDVDLNISSDVVNKVNIISWIKIDDEVMYCPDQKLEITSSNPDLNTAC